MRFTINSFILLILLSSISLYAADINDTLIDGNTTTYKNLLKNIEKDKNITSEEELEKSLLNILLTNHTQVTDNNTTIVIPKNITEYKLLFTRYVDLIEHVSKIEKQRTQNQSKIDTIENEIQKLDQNSFKLLPLELQDALYHKNILLYQNQITSYQNKIKTIKKVLNDSLMHINIDIKSIEKENNDNQLEEQKINNKINSLQIDKEQAELLGDTKESSIIDESIKKLKLQKQTLLKNSLSTQFLLFAYNLQKKDKQVFTSEKQILKEAEKLTSLSSIDYSKLTLLLHAMENKYLGRLQTLTGSGEEEIKSLWYEVWDFISSPIFKLNQTPISILKLIITLFIFIMGFILGSMYKRKIKSMVLNKRSFTTSTRTLLANIGYYFIIVIAFFISLNVLGVKLSSFAMIAGALSVGIGFGLQNIVSNFVSGLILMIERSIKIGDYIEIDDTLRGYVSDIRMRSTTVVTNENIDVIIPNQKLIENNVINWTMSDSIRRFSVPFGVAYGTDAHSVIELVTSAVLESEYKEDIVENTRHQTSVIMTEMGDSSINFELLVWVKGDDLHKPKRTASAFLLLIYDTLNKNNIEIPFPQQDIHIRSVEDKFIIEKKIISK